MVDAEHGSVKFVAVVVYPIGDRLVDRRKLFIASFVGSRRNLDRRNGFKYNLPDILAGLCEALVRNYLNNVGKGKEILAPVVFQGGVAANLGMVKAFERSLGLEVQVPPYYNVMGAVGAAFLAREAVARSGPSRFKGFGVAEAGFKTSAFECSGCANNCEVVEIAEDDRILARWGDRCGKWSNAVEKKEKIS